MWGYGFCLRNSIVQDLAARYRKRFYTESTHAKWDHRLFWARIPPYLLERIDQELVDPQLNSACKAELIEELSHINSNHLLHLYNENERMGRELREGQIAQSAATRDRDAAIAERDGMASSRSWRFTEPLRRLRNL